jgi:hypothetical protein
MLRILFGAVAFALFATGAFACNGQAGKVIFEDKFTDDSGGWSFSEGILVLKAPGATVTVNASEQGIGRDILNQTFTATQGDFCVEMSFPPDAAQLDVAIGVLFLAANDDKYWLAQATSSGVVRLDKLADNKYSKVWQTEANTSLVKTGPTDVNSVRAVVKNGTITVIVNGQTVKSVRALIPSDDLKFGFYAQHTKPSATPILFTVRSYKVTTGE